MNTQLPFCGTPPDFGLAKYIRPFYEKQQVRNCEEGNAPVNQKQVTHSILSEHKAELDNNQSFLHNSDIKNSRNIALLGGDSHIESSWLCSDSDINYPLSEFVGSTWGRAEDSH